MSDKINVENIQLRSEEVQDILTRIPNWMIRWGNVLFLSLILLFLYISWMIKYPDLVTAKAVITTVIPPQKKYAQVTSKIDTILIRENENVTIGQKLAILESTANYEDVFFLKSVLNTLNIKNGTFEFKLDEMPILFLGDIDSEYATFQNSYIQYELNKNLKPYQNHTIANKVALSEQKSRLDVLLIQKELANSEFDLKGKEFERNRILFNKGIISAQDFEKKQIEVLQTEQNLKNLSLTISQTKEAIAVANKNSLSTNIDGARENMVLLKTLIQALNQLKLAIETWEREYVLASDIEGKVSFMNYWSSNQTVTHQDLIFIILPAKDSEYIAKLITPAENSGKIKIGQKVNIDLSNFPGTEFGVLQGEVSRISNFPTLEGEYLVNVSLPQKLITTYGKNINFTQELAGTANIITEDLRLLERIFYQLKRLFVVD